MRRILVLVLTIVLCMCVLMEAFAVEVQIGSDLYTVDNDVDLEFSIEIKTKQFNVNGVLEQLDVDEQKQYLQDYTAFVLIIDALQHNDYLNISKLNVESLLNLIQFVTGKEDVRVVSDGDLSRIWISTHCYFEISEETGVIQTLTLVMPEIKNGFGYPISVDLLL